MRTSCGLAPEADLQAFCQSGDRVHLAAKQKAMLSLHAELWTQVLVFNDRHVGYLTVEAVVAAFLEARH